MPELDPKIAELEDRLNKLVRTQVGFQMEINTIRGELAKLRNAAGLGAVRSQTTYTTSPLASPVEPRPQEPTPRQYQPSPGSSVPPPTFGMKPEASQDRQTSKLGAGFSDFKSKQVASARGDLEKFIGENLLSKIGIIILVLGVGIGAKYAIDNGWISPLMRIVFGYAMGVGLIGVAVRLKAKYHNFSAVLLSGGMAIMYFVTYFAYAYYALLPQTAAFGLMAVFTVITVTAAIWYERQVIAHIGLVGAYAVPFLLSDNSGNYLFLFSYMAIINGGILAIAIRKCWRSLFYTSFAFTWLIFYGWFVTKYTPAEYFYLALAFTGIFFTTFYAMKIVHGVVHKENDDTESLISIIINAIVFYLFTLAISDVTAGFREYTVLFSFVAFFALAILFTSFRFYGRALIYVSYPLTWLIFAVWFADHYNADTHFLLATIFASVFFAIYYVATLIYRLTTDEISMPESVGLLMTNSFVFYGFGYAIMDSRENLRAFEGLFTAGHAVFHSLVAQFVSRFRSSASDVVQILVILIVTFATIAIPVQFDGRVVTLIWAVEAAALFWFGRARTIRVFEYLSYPLMFLATTSLFVDWMNSFFERTSYVSDKNLGPIANGDFVTAMVFIAAFSFIYITNRNEEYETVLEKGLIRPFGWVVGALGLFVLYNSFRIEISNYFHMRSAAAVLDGTGRGFARSSYDIFRFNVIWQLNYTMFFLTALWAVNIRKVRSSILAFAGVGFSILALQFFVVVGMYLFYELRVAYLLYDGASPAFAGPMNIAIRYIAYAFAAALIVSIYVYSRHALLTAHFSRYLLGLGFDAVFYGTMFITASCELVNLMAQAHAPDAYKLGLSILWGVYALFLIGIGISFNKKHLRITAIVLLTVTLIKLFLYDVADLPTIPKTILFVSLGLLILIVSFLYNKYQALIFKSVTEPEKPTVES